MFVTATVDERSDVATRQASRVSSEAFTSLRSRLANTPSTIQARGYGYLWEPFPLASTKFVLPTFTQLISGYQGESEKRPGRDARDCPAHLLIKVSTLGWSMASAILPSHQPTLYISHYYDVSLLALRGGTGGTASCCAEMCRRHQDDTALTAAVHSDFQGLCSDRHSVGRK